MKDQYVGDVNDYLKYALLRSLIDEDTRLGVAWMLTASDHRSDGQRLSYLARPESYRRLDPELYDALGEIVGGVRSIDGVARASLLSGATYVSEVLVDDRNSRRGYFDALWGAVCDCNVVFFDPDNGLEVASVPKGRRQSAKYLYWDELQAAFARGHSLLIYQHFPRRPRRVFFEELAMRIRGETGCTRVLGLVTAHVLFLVVPQPAFQDLLEVRVNAFSSHSAPYTTDVMAF